MTDFDKNMSNLALENMDFYYSMAKNIKLKDLAEFSDRNFWQHRGHPLPPNCPTPVFMKIYALFT